MSKIALYFAAVLVLIAFELYCVTQCKLTPIFYFLTVHSFQVEVTTVFGSASPPLKVNLVRVLGSDSKVITSDNKVAESVATSWDFLVIIVIFCVSQLQFLPNILLIFVSGTSI